MSRLFVAVWPPDDVMQTLTQMPRPAAPGVRWVRPERLHITLRFFGKADEAEAAAALGEARLPATQVTLGPGVERLGRGVLMIPARGLDELAAAVAALTGHVGRRVPERPFAGHLTVARFKHEPPSGYEQPLEASFNATEIALVRSEPPGTYVNVERVALH